MVLKILALIFAALAFLWIMAMGSHSDWRYFLFAAPFVLIFVALLFNIFKKDD